MMLETMKELFGVVHIRDDEEEVTNKKHMRVGEEKLSLSQPLLWSHRRKRRSQSHRTPLSWSHEGRSPIEGR
jgi:hypothetical protein